jgi:hypothetical protein
MNLSRVLDILIPRFMTEDAAADLHFCDHCNKPHPQPVCSMKDIEPGEVFAGIMTVRFFNLFGLSLFPRFDGVMRPWVNPHDKAEP